MRISGKQKTIGWKLPWFPLGSRVPSQTTSEAWGEVWIPGLRALKQEGPRWSSCSGLPQVCGTGVPQIKPFAVRWLWEALPVKALNTHWSFTPQVCILQGLRRLTAKTPAHLYLAFIWHLGALWGMSIWSELCISYLREKIIKKRVICSRSQPMARSGLEARLRAHVRAGISRRYHETLEYELSISRILTAGQHRPRSTPRPPLRHKHQLGPY